LDAASLALVKASVSYLATLHLALSSKSLWTSSSISLKFSSSDFSFFSSIGLEELVCCLGSPYGLLLKPAEALDFIAVPSLCWAVPLMAVPMAALDPTAPLF
jgi:hypothetical protein